jgi:aspartate ammonia-lyase
VYPTALKVAAIEGLRAAASGFEALQGALQRKEQAFGGIVCMGRTEGQDAVPMTLGAMFSSWAEAFARDRWRAFKGEERLRVVNLGGTAVGTGLTAPRRYIFLVIEKLRALTGYGLARGENPVEQTANADALVEVSGLLKTAATNFIKLARDLRFLQSQGEIRLPACQAGSSIMPGKINPVRLEAAIAAGLQMKANDSLLADAVSLGTLQIHEFMPTIAYALLESLQLAERTCRMLAPHVDGIEADEDVCRGRVDRSPTLVTALLPAIGYRRAEVLARALAASGRTDVRAFLSEQLGAACVDEALAPRRLMALGYRDDG